NSGEIWLKNVLRLRRGMILITPVGIKGEMLRASALRAECLMGGVWGRKLEAWGLKQKTLAALDGRRQKSSSVQRPASLLIPQQIDGVANRFRARVDQFQGNVHRGAYRHVLLAGQFSRQVLRGGKAAAGDHAV